MEKTSDTAEFAAACRAGPFAYPPGERPYQDPYAPLFISSPTYRFLSNNRTANRLMRIVLDALYAGIVGEVLLRGRYSDEALGDALEAGVDQVVLLSAGYDSTALRFGLRNGDCSFYEIDHPATQARKREIIAQRDIPVPESVRFVACDYVVDSLGERLMAEGYDRKRPSFINWLAVTFYLSEEAVEETFGELRSLCAPGSRIVFNYLHRSVIDESTSIAAARRAKWTRDHSDEPWTFGFDPEQLEGWLAKRGFRTIDHVSGAGLAHRYYPEGSPVKAAEYISLVTAERVGEGED